jgi:predicted Na+-dependent transporter
MGCLVDIVVAVVLLVILGLVFGEAHHHGGSYSVHLTAVPTLIFVGLLLIYLFAYRLPRRRRRRAVR